MTKHESLKLLVLAVLLSLLGGCGDAIELQSGKEKILQPEVAISIAGIASSQVAPLELDGREFLLLASETRGLVLVTAHGLEVASAGQGSVERFTLHRLSSGDWRIFAADESAALLQVYSLEQEKHGRAELRLLASHPTGVPLTALCAASRDQASQLFTIDEHGLGREYRIFSSGAGWRFAPVRSLHFGEQVTGCAIDARRQQLLVAQPPLGVWQLNASAERDEKRRVFVSGDKLPVESAGLWLDTQRDLLWLAAGDSVSAYSLDAGSEVFSATVEGLEPVSAASFSAGIVLVGEEADQVFVGGADALPPKKPQEPREEPVPTHTVSARAETAPVGSGGDAADDPAIWINPANSARSLILGTDKKQGLNVYNLDGALRQSFAVGRVNNVDLRPVTHPRYQSIAAASNRTTPGISLFGITAAGEVESLGLQPLNLQDPYGLCLYQAGADLFAWVSDKEGGLQLAEIDLGAGTQPWQLHARAELPVQSQVEGCVADDARRVLFFGEEDRGVWRLDIAAFLAGEGKPELVAPADGAHLVADVEGLDLYLPGGEGGYLVVSSQGDDSYALYTRDGSRFVGRFRVGENLGRGIDGSSETDGLAVTASGLGPDYPAGLLVVQDGRNRMPGEAQNFKLVSWAEIAKSLSL